MSEVATASNKKLDVFVDSLVAGTNFSPTVIAERFSTFCGLLAPLEYNDIVDACYSLGVDEITPGRLPDSLRGFNSDYANNIQIRLRSREWEGGISHTLLHELFEIIINRFNKKISGHYNLTEYSANLFAASLLMPEKTFLEFSLRANMDLQLIHEKYYQSYFSLLLRLHYLLRQRGIHYIGIMVENEAAKLNWRAMTSLNELKNFKINKMTTDQTDYLHNYQSLVGWLNKCHDAIMAQEYENKTTVYLEDNNFIIKASPLLNPQNYTIRLIGIQIMTKAGYQKLVKEILRK